MFLKREPFDNSKKPKPRWSRSWPRIRNSAPLVKLADIHILRGPSGPRPGILAQAITLEPENFTNVAALAEVNSRDGKEAEANQVIQIFLEEHPESKEAFPKTCPLDDERPPRGQDAFAQEQSKKFPEDGSFLL